MAMADPELSELNTQHFLRSLSAALNQCFVELNRLHDAFAQEALWEETEEGFAVLMNVYDRRYPGFNIMAGNQLKERFPDIERR
jgi:hypothetical protein